MRKIFTFFAAAALALSAFATDYAGKISVLINGVEHKKLPSALFKTKMKPTS